LPQHPNNRPRQSATVASAMRQFPTYAPQQTARNLLRTRSAANSGSRSGFSFCFCAPTEFGSPLRLPCYKPPGFGVAGTGASTSKSVFYIAGYRPMERESYEFTVEAEDQATAGRGAQALADALREADGVLEADRRKADDTTMDLGAIVSVIATSGATLAWRSGRGTGITVGGADRRSAKLMPSSRQGGSS
jgi:hypothetical protein